MSHLHWHGGALGDAQALFEGLNAVAIETSDDGFDIGAYLAAARNVTESITCFLKA